MIDQRIAECTCSEEVANVLENETLGHEMEALRRAVVIIAREVERISDRNRAADQPVDGVY